MITQAQLKEIFSYADGNLVWLKPASNRVQPGDIAGNYDNSSGYIKIGFQGKRHYAHRLIYIYHHGKLPTMIDHINRDRTDNHIENLRPTTHSKNRANSIRTTTGHRGISFHKHSGLWHAKITIDGKVRSLKYFKTQEEAQAVYDAAAIAHFGDHSALKGL